MSIFVFKKKVCKNYIFCCFEESYTWSYFILIHVIFVLINVLFSYTGPIFLAHFQKNPGFFQIFPDFSYVVMYFFRSITETICDAKLHNYPVKKIMYFLGFFIFKILFLKWNLDIYKCPFLILKKKFVKMIYFIFSYNQYK